MTKGCYWPFAALRNIWPKTLIAYFKTVFSDWRSRWNQPTTREDRYVAALCGAIAGSIIGFIARIFVGDIPGPWEQFAVWAASGLVIFSMFGFVFPKPIMLASWPFVKILNGL